MIRLEGGTRVVFLISCFAIKIIKKEYYRSQSDQNRNEVDWWEGTHDSRLCPIISHFFDRRIVIMKRAEPLSIDQYKIAFPTDESMLEYFDNIYRYPNSNLQSTILPHEPKLDGFGTLNGKIVITDYGNDPFPK